MYHKYFGLDEPAFSIAVNPRYLYMSKQHKEALAHLLYGIQGGGFVMLSGEVGTGKTTIIRSLLEQLPDNTEIAIVLNPMAEAIDILGTVCDELGIEYNKDDISIKILTDALQERLLENHRAGRNTVLLIDEAQLLSAEVLEQIRLLTNLETATEKLLQIVLVGQPELNMLLAQPRLRQLSQRITARFHLKPLTVEETWAYVNHRLSIAGMPEDRNPFTPRIVKRIHSFTEGIPRKINILCERILIGTYGHNKSKVDGKIFDLAKSEVTGQTSVPIMANLVNKDNIWKFAALASVSVLMIVLVSMVFSVFGDSDEVKATVPETVTTTLPPAAAQDPAPAPLPKPQESKTSLAQKIEENRILLESTAVANEPAQTEIQEPAEQYFNKAMKAKKALFSFLGFRVEEEYYPCWQLAEINLDCRKVELQTWDELKQINRPAILTLRSEERLSNYALITGISDDLATLEDTEQNRFTVSLRSLGPQWTGETFYVWKRPPGFKSPLSKGQRGETINWLARQFALIDGQDSPLTNSLFNQKLETRVKIFQRNHELKDDGIIGQQTLMKLNEAMGIDKTLLVANNEL